MGNQTGVRSPESLDGAKSYIFLNEFVFAPCAMFGLKGKKS